MCLGWKSIFIHCCEYSICLSIWKLIYFSYGKISQINSLMISISLFLCLFFMELLLFGFYPRIYPLNLLLFCSAFWENSSMVSSKLWVFKISATISLIHKISSNFFILLLLLNHVLSNILRCLGISGWCLCFSRRSRKANRKLWLLGGICCLWALLENLWSQTF